jgi:hypothetical protein
VESNLDWMGIAGITFLVAMTLIVAWIGRAVVLKAMDMSLARAQAKVDVKHQQEYQRISRETAHAQEALAERLKSLDGIDVRLAEIERMLREVDEPALAGR